ncbi:hypothetical protein SCUCBS95973_007610 [Sporothrix curviconia]|uniref:ubiquitinyl hydrolase 1 n=1 Tax=Sporothrix curviconia TaxID=1260050 RepID=A0ABP0CEN1_9PEZI
MNNNHLPAGRAAHGAGAGPGMADMPGAGFGIQQGTNGAVHNHNGHNSHNGHNGYNGHNGHHGGRGGGARRGRHYNNNNNNNNSNNNYNGYNYNQNHVPHNQQGQHGQFPQQMYAQQGYMPLFNTQQYGYPPIPPPMAPNYMQFAQQQQQQYQPPPYGRPGAGMQGQYAPMGGAPMGGAPMGIQPLAPPGVLPHQHPAQHALALPHTMPQPHTPGFAGAPLVVSTPQPDQFAMHSAVPAHQSPSVAHSTFLPPSGQTPMGLPPSLPPHNPIPPHGDMHRSVSNSFVVPPPYSGVAPVVAPVVAAATPTAPLATLSTNVMATETRSVPGQQIEEASGSVTTVSSEAQPTPTSDVDPTKTPAAGASPLVAASKMEAAEAAPIDPSQARKPFEKISLPWTSSATPIPPRPARLRRRRRNMRGVNVQLPFSQQDSAPAVSAAAPQTPQTPAATASAATPTPTKAVVASPSSANGAVSRAAVAVIPALPVRQAENKPSNAAEPAKAEIAAAIASANASPAEGEAASNGDAAADAAPPPAPSGLKSWANLFTKTAAAGGIAGANGGAATNGHAANGTNGTSGAFTKANANSLAEAVSSYRVGSSSKVAFIEPRGLINTGNMCYMNSVLQVLTFCVPFYDFLDQVGQKAAFSFKSETPMIDAMIMFIREFKVIDRAAALDLRKRLRNDELERYGEAFTPEFVYHAINQLPRFSSMIRGQQQDAEEFLGFLLESLNEECAKVLQDAASANGSAPTSGQATPTTVASEVPDVSRNGGGWLEVGHRQRSVVTRSSGHTSISPVNSIFSGLLRSELRVPGHKDSVTLEPYQSLQLHIDSAEVRNIVDALRNLTNPEVLHGSFKSPQGKDVSATKQVFIEDLPPVLILHLKRFQFDWQVNGTIKIWKKVGYPLELEIPREIFSRTKRNTLLSKPLPKYQLNAVVYHHGKQAGGGHYTVDALREDGREWIRLDDTVIRRIRREEVAEAGAEETGSTGSNNNNTSNGSAAAANKRDAASAATAGSVNRFAGMVDEDAGDNDNGWSAPVNGNGKKWSAVANGATSPKNKPPPKDNIKDNKVAYLLFYQRIN